MRRIEAVEKDLKALAQSSASKDDLSRVRAELKKVYDGLHIGAYAILNCLLVIILTPNTEFLDLRSHVWGMRKSSVQR